MHAFPFRLSWRVPEETLQKLLPRDWRNSIPVDRSAAYARSLARALDRVKTTRKKAKPEDARAALKGWAFFAVLMAGIFGLAYALIEV
ncbi:hypothetical protein CK227_35170 [Mesorhizobium sp. WSM4308]|nr:hypothetical protein CK232_34680 [Mesorhizobium sp. WSM4304]PBB70853.1 hypothetical protein CK227_35170 [Mesorhizobium sp. WSM4308]